MRNRLPGARGRRGSTLVTVSILLGTMTVLALVFLRAGQSVSQEQDSNLEETRATLLAEAGISEAMEALRAGASGNVGRPANPAYLGGGVVWVEATDLGGGRTQLDAISMKDGGRAALRVVVEDGNANLPGAGGPGNGFPGMLFANQHLQIDQDILIDSYDSSLGTYASQAIHTDGTTTYAGKSGGASGNSTIQVDTGVKVFGDVSCGPGIAPVLGGTAFVAGSTEPRSETIPLSPVPVPVVPVSGAYSVANNTTKTIDPGVYHFTSLTQGKFSKLTIVGPATLVIDGYSAAVAATLEVDCTKGPITIYDTGAWSVDRNYTVRPAPGSPVDAAFLISSKDTVQFDQGSKILVGFYAPHATIQVDQGAEVWGGLVADRIEVNQGTHFHFDENLRNFELPWEIPAESSAGADPQVISWSRIEFPLREFSADRRDPFTLLQVQPSELRAPSEAWEEPQDQGILDTRGLLR